MIMKHGNEGGQVIADMHRDLRVGKHTPHRTGQVLVAQLGDPTSPGVVDGECHARLKYVTGLFGKAAAGEIDQAEFGIREPAAGGEQSPDGRVDDPREARLEGLNQFRA